MKRAIVSLLVLIGSGLWVAALMIMAQTVQQSENFSDLHPFIVAINVGGLIVLFILIGGRLAQLVRDWRKRVVGSRLEARMVIMSASLAVVPLLLVFYFSVVFLNRGIDSWFHIEIREGLQDALDAVARGARPAHARVRGAHAAHRRRAVHTQRGSGAHPCRVAIKE